MAYATFDGSDDSLILGAGGWDLDGPQTWVALVRPTADYRVLWSAHDAEGYGVGLSVETRSDGTLWIYSMPTSTSAWTRSGVLPLNEWRLLALTWDGTESEPTVHVGDLRGGWTHEQATGTLHAPALAGPRGELRVGEYEGGYWFQGDFAALAVWPRVLSDVAIEGLADLPIYQWLSVGGGPAGLWTFDVANVHDRTGHNADVIGGTWTVTAGDPPISYRGSAPVTLTSTNLDGTDDSIWVAPGDVDDGGTSAWSIAMLIRPERATYQVLAAGHNSAGLQRGYAFEVWHGGGLAVFYGGSASEVFGVVGAMTAGNWYLVGASKAAGLAPVRLHVYDVAAGRWTRETTGDLTVASVPWAAGGTFRFGEWAGGYWFGGDIAAAAVWHDQLSDGDFDALPDLLLAEWADHKSPVAAWLFQAGESLADLVGDADELTRTGTGTGDDAPILRFLAPVSGSSAAITGGSLTLTASGGRYAAGSAELAGAGTMEAIGGRGIPRGDATLDAFVFGLLAGHKTGAGSGELAAAGTAAPEGVKAAHGAAEATATGATTAAGAKEGHGAAAVDGLVEGTATGWRTALVGTVMLEAAGELAAMAGRLAVGVTAGLEAGGSATTAGGKRAAGTSSIAGGGDLTATGRVRHRVSVVASAVATLDAIGRKRGYRPLIRSRGYTALAAIGWRTATRTSEIAGRARLVSAGHKTGAGSPLLAATGSPTVRRSRKRTTVSCALAADTVLLAAAWRLPGGSGTLSTTGDLMAGGSKGVIVSALLASAGVPLADDGAKVAAASALTDAVGVLMARGRPRRPPTAPRLVGAVSGRAVREPSSGAVFREPEQATARFDTPKIGGTIA